MPLRIDATSCRPELLLVLAGAVSAGTGGATPLEHATLPHLRSLAATGTVGALDPVAPGLPVTRAAAAAALLGLRLDAPLDPGAVAMESLGKLLADGEHCTVVEVLDVTGASAPVLEVQRAAAALQSQLRFSRVVGQLGGHRLLVAGSTDLQLPRLEGLMLRQLPQGGRPPRTLDHTTVVIAGAGSALLGVGGLAGARTVALARAELGARGEGPAENLRSIALAELSAGAQTVIVESLAAQSARAVAAADRARLAAVRTALERIDRTLIAPLAAAAGWLGARFAVTSDLPRRTRGAPVAGLVPVVRAGDRGAQAAAANTRARVRLLAPLGTTPPPAYCERALPSLSRLAHPFAAGDSARGPGRDEAPITARRARPAAMLAG